MNWQTNHFASLSGIKVAADNGTLGGYVNATDLQGPAGPGINFRGAWAASTAYAVNDLVTYGGSAYIAPAAFTSGSSFNSANWLVFAAAGAAGSSVTYGTTAGTAAQGNDSRIVNALQSTNNLSDVGNAATARTNLGVTAMATLATAAQGSVVYYGASGPTVLAPGTSGYVLQTAGAGANPSWVAPSTGGISLPSGTAGQLLWNNAGTLAPVTVSGATFSSGTLTITSAGGGGGGGVSAASLADGTTLIANTNGTLSVNSEAIPALSSAPGGALPGDQLGVLDRAGADYKVGLSDPWTFGKTVRVMPQAVVWSSGGNTIDVSTGNTFYIGISVSFSSTGVPSITGTSGNVSITIAGISGATEGQEVSIYIFHGASVGSITVSGGNVHFTGGATSYTSPAGAGGVTLLTGVVVNQNLGLTGLRFL